MGLTFLIESVVAAVLARPLGLTPWRCAGSAVLASTITHPILWAVFYAVSDVWGPMATPVLEAAVIAAEAPAYRVLATKRWDDAGLLSLLANAASWAGGELIYSLT